MKYRAAPLLLLMLPGFARAQDRALTQQSSPVMDMIERAKNALNSLQYTQARTIAREVLALGKLKRAQEIAALQVASAAYYPDDYSARMPDSARIFLRRLARIMPTGALPADLVSPALDSQLVKARETTFGATARVPIEITVRGTETRPAIDVVSTRAARWQLYLVSGDGAAPILLDTLGSSTGGRLSLRAHNGIAPVIQPGDYQLRIVGISTSDPDTITLRFDSSVKGAVPTLVELPSPPDPSRILPERASKALGAGIAGGIIVGGGTWALANVLRPPGALGDESKDGRGTVIGIGISVGAVAAGLLDKGRPLPENIRANAATRSAYLKQLGEATETNRKRIGEYTLAITIDPEIK